MKDVRLIPLLLMASSAFAQTGDFRLASSAVEWTERLPDGTLYVHERGVRLDVSVKVPLRSGKTIDVDYRGSVYGSVVYKQGWDSQRFTIPNGYESLITVGQAGTAHFLAGSFACPAGMLTARPEIALGVDTWYRPLKYYEIWLVPLARYGCHFSSRSVPTWSVFVGAQTTITPRQFTQTRNPPWNAGYNITQSLAGDTRPTAAVSWPTRRGARIEAAFSEYRFQKGPVRVLRPGVGIYQPSSRLITFTAAYTKSF